jgi:serine/threonine protein kinase
LDHKASFFFIWLQEVDIWSFGCLLLELLTLEIPYLGLSELQMHDLIQVDLSISLQKKKRKRKRKRKGKRKKEVD